MAITVAVKYRLKPGKRNELLSFGAENVFDTRREPGNLAYSHYPSIEDEQEMFVFELWENMANLEAHIRMPHYVAFANRRMPILESWEAPTASSTRELPTRGTPAAGGSRARDIQSMPWSLGRKPVGVPASSNFI
jgi:quinol monooxygenase YgiN